MARLHIEPHVELNESYKNFTLPGFNPSGCHFKVLSLDVDSGACSMKMRFDGGYTRKPGLSYSDMEMFILKGSMNIGGITHKEGHYIFVPAGYALGAIDVPQGCESLVFYNDSEPNFEESDVNHPLCLKEAFVSMNSYDDAPWMPGNIVQPATAAGVMIKILRYDVLTEAMSFMYTMTPQYKQDNISYHDCAEESYHIWGSSWMMQFGELPTGGYFWRPPYINHGSFRSALGTIAFGRTDSKLHNYFHFNPWSNPDENKLRAAAQLYRQRPELYQWAMAEDGHNHPHGPADFEHSHYHNHPQTRHLHGDHSQPHTHHHHDHDHD
jgi:hypothetical protein